MRRRHLPAEGGHNQLRHFSAAPGLASWARLRPRYRLNQSAATQALISARRVHT
jgi:hypothetical protein